MANPTAAVPSFVVAANQEVSKFTISGTVQDYFPNEMVGLIQNGANAGFVEKYDDTQDMLFLGLIENSVRISVLTGDGNGARTADVIRPRYFSAKIAAAVATDVGKPVYAKFSNEVQYTTGTFGNLVGHVAAFRSATEILVAPEPWVLDRGAGGLYVGARTLPATGAQLLTLGDLNKAIYLTGTAAQAITLPAVAGTVPGDRYWFKKVSGGTFTMTITGNAAENIDGANTNASITGNFKGLEIVSDGTQWLIAAAV